MIEEDCPFTCPYCGVDLSCRIDKSGGSKQKFIQDCETCCSPIEIEIHLKGDEVIHFSADALD